MFIAFLGKINFLLRSVVMHSNKKCATSRMSDNQDSLSSQLSLQQLDDNEQHVVSSDTSTEFSNVRDATSCSVEDGAIGGFTHFANNSNDSGLNTLSDQLTNDSVDTITSVATDENQLCCSSVRVNNVVQLPLTPGTSKSTKKRSKFWGFWKRGRRSTALPKCVETGEDDPGSISAEVSGCFSRSGLCGRSSCESASIAWPVSRRRGSPDPESPTPGNVRRFSMGAGSRSFGMLSGAHQMALIPPAPMIQTLTDVATHSHIVFGRTTNDFDLRLDDSSATQIGYPHLHFSQSLSSSSSSSSGISVPLLPAPPTPDYPPFCLVPPAVHSQVDYMHCLVPDLLELTNCCFYWGVMDRYEAERLLDGRPEGTFLVRDSAQEEFLFSVSFRRYGRSLHARIEQWKHTFSFDSRDSDVFAAHSVCALVEHYKDPAACMFFEPMLTLPLPRNFAFTLQHLCRAAICSRVKYDDILALHLPRQLQEYLRYYHYKERICMRRFEPH